jgi:lipoate-protein ligase A
MTVDAISRAADAAVFLQREAELQAEADRTGDEFAWLWEVERPAVVVGRSGNVDAEVRVAACAADRIPVLRRLSGGGAVLLALGCLNYTLILNLERRPALSDVAKSYNHILPSLIRAAQCRGLIFAGSDLVIGGKKIGGCSQKRSRRTVLHHGTILYDLDLSLVSRYLHEPARQPGYRRGRSHLQFLANAPLDSGFAERILSEYPGAKGIE